LRSPTLPSFFGRENEIRDGLDTLGQQRRFGGARFALWLGASGSGKSSLLRAGIIPRLRRNPDQWIVVPPFRPLGRPFESLAYALAAGFDGAGAKREWKDLYELMAAGRAGDVLGQLARELRFSMYRPEATVLPCMDQLEELFTLSEPNETERFLAVAEAATAARNWLFEHFPLARAASFIRPDNFASKRVAERLGAVYERTSESRGSTYECWVHYRG
jgi:hypothetical protein